MDGCRQSEALVCLALDAVGWLMMVGWMEVCEEVLVVCRGVLYYMVMAEEESLVELCYMVRAWVMVVEMLVGQVVEMLAGQMVGMLVGQY